MVRMDRERLPRKLMFSKVRHKRRSGGQFLTWGKRIRGEMSRALEASSMGVRNRIKGRNGIGWVRYAENRADWREFSASVI